MLALLSAELRVLKLRHVPAKADSPASLDLLRRGLRYDVFRQEREAS